MLKKKKNSDGISWSSGIAKHCLESNCKVNSYIIFFIDAKETFKVQL